MNIPSNSGVLMPMIGRRQATVVQIKVHRLSKIFLPGFIFVLTFAGNFRET